MKGGFRSNGEMVCDGSGHVPTELAEHWFAVEPEGPLRFQLLIVDQAEEMVLSIVARPDCFHRPTASTTYYTHKTPAYPLQARTAMGPSRRHVSFCVTNPRHRDTDAVSEHGSELTNRSAISKDAEPLECGQPISEPMT